LYDLQESSFAMSVGENMKYLFLIIFLFPFLSFAQEPSVWKPTPVEVEFTSDLKIDTFYLKETVPTPVEGIILTRGQISDIKVKLKICNKNLEKSIVEQRNICDTKLKKCNFDCFKLNEQLIIEKKSLSEKLLLKEEELKKLKFTNKVILITSSSFVTILTVSLLYATL
tara:strand:- start:48 stop:554 length:507 start_codon:yes stop_codon:yes gene_type:complete